MNKTTIIAEPGKQEVTITRIFDAPCELVFKVSTDPEAIPHWWGPGFLKTAVESFDTKPGGKWRIVQTDPSGTTHGFHGVYHEAMAPKRIVRTFEYEGMPGHVALETSIFENIGGKTKLTTQSVFQTLADRDGMVASGMESGVVESHNRLDVLLLKSAR
jgi:uncharacterized protein YndB with AHSA1/START domain